MINKIADYLNDSGPECKKRLMAHYAEEVAEFSHLLSKQQETLAEYSVRRSVSSPLAQREVAFGLMVKSANTLMAGFEIALSGYYWESPILFRNAVEGCATAWDLVHNETSYATWQGKKLFKSAESVARLAKEDAVYGRFWGNLSNSNVHTNQGNSSPAQLLIDGVPKMQTFGLVPNGKEESRRFNIEFALLCAHVCLQLTEVVFFPFISQAETVTKADNEDFVRVVTSARHRRFVDSFEQTCKRMIDAPEGQM